MASSPIAKAPPNDAWKAAFLEAYRQSGNMTASSKLVGISYTWVKNVRMETHANYDPVFAQAVADILAELIHTVDQTLHGLATGHYSKAVTIAGRPHMEPIFDVRAAELWLRLNDERYRVRPSGDDSSRGVGINVTVDSATLRRAALETIERLKLDALPVCNDREAAKGRG
jgi:hypothetical protein